jgi:predicted transcriptional regulator of viral defense system
VWNKRMASQVLRMCAENRRRVISDWRILIAARRNAHAENAPLPDEKKAVAIRKELIQRGDISPVKGVDGVYTVDVPYANLLEVSEQQIIQEANPWAVFGFLTAMVHHGLTDLLPNTVYAIQFKDGEQLYQVPLGTTPDDWTDLELPAGKHPDKVNEIPIVWTQIEAKWEFGVTIGYSLGVPIYVTDVERTLIDGIRMPEKCGGIAKVLQAWRSADSMDVDKVVAYADRYDIQNLRQRVGFLLEKLCREHPRLKEWQHRLQRGGSVKLVAGDAYSGTYSTEWNLSLNVPPSILAIIEQD